jgi:hypothetical protein
MATDSISTDSKGFESIGDHLPLYVIFFVLLLVVEWCLGQTEWKPLLSGAITFLVAWSGHLLLAKPITQFAGLTNLEGDAFGPFTTLIGLVFSLQLGQTYSYYFDRQGAIQDAAFREVSGLQRLLELSLSFANSRGLLPSDGSASSATALGLLEELEAEVASLAPGGDGLTSTTQLVVKNEKRALQRLLDGLNKARRRLPNACGHWQCSSLRW